MLGKTAGGQEDLWAGRVAGPLPLKGPRNNTQHTTHNTHHTPHTTHHTPHTTHKTIPWPGLSTTAHRQGTFSELLLSSHASGGIVSRLFTSPAPSEGSHE